MISFLSLTHKLTGWAGTVIEEVRIRVAEADNAAAYREAVRYYREAGSDDPAAAARSERTQHAMVSQFMAYANRRYSEGQYDLEEAKAAWLETNGPTIERVLGKPAAVGLASVVDDMVADDILDAANLRHFDRRMKAEVDAICADERRKRRLGRWYARHKAA